VLRTSRERDNDFLDLVLRLTETGAGEATAEVVTLRVNGGEIAAGRA
jgi:hypothetical protein